MYNGIMNVTQYPIHKKQEFSRTFSRLDMLWERYPKYHEKTKFSTLDQLLEEHESYQKDFEEDLREEYIKKEYEDFLVPGGADATL